MRKPPSELRMWLVKKALERGLSYLYTPPLGYRLGIEKINGDIPGDLIVTTTLLEEPPLPREEDDPE